MNKNTRTQRQGGRGGRLSCICLALILAGAVLCFGLLWKKEPVTFQYRDMTLEAKEGVPVNRYNPAGFVQDETGRVRYIQGDVCAKEGVDVSFYQGEIDWNAAAADGVDFAMIRLGYRGYTEGKLNLDSRFEANIRGALDAGVEVGVYFFSQATTPEEAEEEASFVLGALEGYDLTYPVAFDWEPITPGKGARTDGVDGQTLTQCAVAFCQKIQESGYTPAVYFNQELGYLTLDLAQLAQYPFWLAEYDSAPDFYYGFRLWQYTDRGTVDGIPGGVDLNLDFGVFQGTAPDGRG